jgi:TRAP-type C4-dicarboxylate transport system substrate-binding protein
VDGDIKIYKDRLQQAGMSFTPAAPADMKAMLDSAQGVWGEWTQKGGPVAKEMVDKIKTAVQAKK